MSRVDKSNGLPTALSLAAVGGLVDAVVYLDHQHVFATSMTGNLISLASTLLTKPAEQSLRFAGPIAAYLIGIFCAWALKDPTKPRRVPLGLLLQAVVLGVVGYYSGRLPGPVVASILAFATSAQIANYRDVDGFQYNSMFMTGNLRTLMESLYDSFARGGDANAGTRRKARRQARDMALIVALFLGGVVAGASVVGRFQDRALWAGIPLLLFVTVYRIVEEHRTT